MEDGMSGSIKGQSGPLDNFTTPDRTYLVMTADEDQKD